MSVDGFYLIIIDRDASVFNIEGPMKDDEKWNEKVWSSPGSVDTKVKLQ